MEGSSTSRRKSPMSLILSRKALHRSDLKVTNLENGKTATVKIEDRGPYVNGRVVDLTPKVADELDLKQKGVAPVRSESHESGERQDGDGQDRGSRPLREWKGRRPHAESRR